MQFAKVDFYERLFPKEKSMGSNQSFTIRTFAIVIVFYERYTLISYGVLVLIL